MGTLAVAACVDLSFLTGLVWFGSDSLSDGLGFQFELTQLTGPDVNVVFWINGTNLRHGPGGRTWSWKPDPERGSGPI